MHGNDLLIALCAEHAPLYVGFKDNLIFFWACSYVSLAFQLKCCPLWERSHGKRTTALFRIPFISVFNVVMCPSSSRAIAIAGRFSGPACMSSSLAAHSHCFIQKAASRRGIKTSSNRDKARMNSLLGKCVSFVFTDKLCFLPVNVNKQQDVCHPSILLSVCLSRARPSDANPSLPQRVLLGFAGRCQTVLFFLLRLHALPMMQGIKRSFDLRCCFWSGFCPCHSLCTRRSLRHASP